MKEDFEISEVAAMEDSLDSVQWPSEVPAATEEVLAYYHSLTSIWAIS